MVLKTECCEETLNTCSMSCGGKLPGDSLWLVASSGPFMKNEVGTVHDTKLECPAIGTLNNCCGINEETVIVSL